MGLIARIGTVFQGDPRNIPTVNNITDPEIKELLNRAMKSKQVVSSTGEVMVDANAKTFRIDTPKALTVTLPQGTLTSGLMTVAGADTFQTIALFSMDGKDVVQSHSLLLFQLTDVVNSGVSFTDHTKTRMTSKGRLPLLLRKGKCTVSLAIAGDYRIEALATDGSVLGTVPGSAQNGRFSFAVDNSKFGGVFAYCLKRKSSVK